MAKLSPISVYFSVAVFTLLTFPQSTFSQTGVQLTTDEEMMQPAFYAGSSATEFINLCKDAAGNYDFADPTCIANDVDLPPNDPRTEPLKLQRRVDLEFAIRKVDSFKVRLEGKVEFIIQVVFFLLPLAFGLRLVLVKHFDFQTLTNLYYIDPTFGMPCWQYLRMKYAAIKISHWEMATEATPDEHADDDDHHAEQEHEGQVPVETEPLESDVEGVGVAEVTETDTELEESEVEQPENQADAEAEHAEIAKT